MNGGRLPSPAMIVACLALLAAIGVTAFAAAKIDGADIEKDTVTGKQIKESTLGQVPSAARAGSADTATSAARAGSADTAANAARAGSADTAARAQVADRLGGSVPSDFFPASKVQTFNRKLAFGETQTLFSVGTLTFSAKCVENQASPAGEAGQDVVEL